MPHSDRHHTSCSSCLVQPSYVFDPAICSCEVPPTPQPDQGTPQWESWPSICVEVEVPCCRLPDLQHCFSCDEPPIPDCLCQEH